jgi:hypothetical protein
VTGKPVQALGDLAKLIELRPKDAKRIRTKAKLKFFARCFS